ncbi:MAG: deoxyribonuclease IV [Thermoplasmata archaeon]|nr:deoxyribonuclease IV [Thermoplasmata archaeon]
MYLGAHIGIAGGLARAPVEGRQIGCEAIQIFSKSPQMWAGPPIAPEGAVQFRQAVVREGLRATAVHHGYLLNLASPKPAMLRQSQKAFLDEIQRAELLGVDGLIFHPGAHTGSGVEAGIASITANLNDTFLATPGVHVRALLENSAGQGTTLCSNFEELQAIVTGLETPARAGVALDTCHLFAAGFDFRTAEGYGALVDRIRDTIGIERVHAFHLNDAKSGLGSHLDRHENIGHGEIGLEGFRHLVNDRRWRSVPGYLETPLDENGYARYATDLRALTTLRPRTSGGSSVTRPTGRARTRPPAAVK